jgi:hypothetical protein
LGTAWNEIFVKSAIQFGSVRIVDHAIVLEVEMDKHDGFKRTSVYAVAGSFEDKDHFDLVANASDPGNGTEVLILHGER